MKRRFITIFICIMTMVSMFTFSIGATTEETNVSENYVEVTDKDMLLVEKLESFGVITNEYDITTYVTRRQMAEIITKYIGLSHYEGTSSETSFRDVSVDDESAYEINALYDLGIITGDNNLRFYPDNYVTCDEATVFIVNAIGYKTFAQREGGYPTGYHRIAIKLGMYNNLSVNMGTSKMSVIDIYKMLDSALSAAGVIPIYTGTDDTKYTFSETETFLSKTYGIKKYKGKVTGNAYTKLTVADSKLTDEQIEIDKNVYDTPGTFYGYLLGYSVDYYIKESAGEKELVYVEETSKLNKTLKLDAEDIIKSKTTSDRIYYNEDRDVQHIDIAKNRDVIYNNQCLTGYGTLLDLIPENGYIEVLDNNKDGVYDIVFVYEYKNYVVDYVDAYNEVVKYKPSRAELNLNSRKHKVQYINLDGNVSASFSDISQGDVLSVAQSKGTNNVITVYISKTPIIGAITEYDDSLGYNIGGVYYEKAKDYVGETLKLGLSGAFYVDINNNIVSHKYDSSSSDLAIGVMMALGYDSGRSKANIEVRLFTADEEVIEVKLADVVKIDGKKRELKNKDDVKAVLEAISKSTDEPYEVKNTYAVRYKISSDDLLSELDTGAKGGIGNINVEVDNGEYLLSRYYGMLTCYTKKEGGGYSPTKYIRYNSANTIIFYTPSAGRLDEVEEYGLVTNFKYNRYYAKPSIRSDEYTDFIDNYSLYSFHTTDIELVDIIILRDYGVAGELTSSSPIGVITKITKGADEDGNATDRIYMGDGIKGDLADEVNFKKNGKGPTKVSSKDLVKTELKAGVVIRYGKNREGKIDTIHVIAEYDSEKKLITPTFKDANTFIESSDIANKVSNLLVAEVLNNDAEAKMIKCTTDGKDALPFVTENASVKIYRSEWQELENATIADIAPEDKIVARIGEYFDIREIIIFR